MASINRDEISRLELLQAAHPDGLVFPHLADAYRRAGRYAQAETVLTAGLRRHSDYSSAHVVLGRLRLDQGKHAEAERAFRRVLELDPQNQIALESLGQVSLEQGRIREALLQFQRLARLKPTAEIKERVRELENRVSELRRDGQFGSLAHDGERTGAISGRPGKGSAAAHAADADKALDDTLQEEAAQSAEAARTSDPGDVVTETMAELYARQGLHRRAASVYRQLLQRTPGDERLRAKVNEAERAGAATVESSRPERIAEIELDWSAPAASGTPVEPKARGAPARPEPYSAPLTAGVTVREHLTGLLRWHGPAAPGAAASNGSGPAHEPGSDDDQPIESAPAATPESVLGLGDPGVRAVADLFPGPVLESESEPAVKGVASAAAEPAGVWSRLEGESSDVDASGAGDAGAMARSLIAITDMLVGLLEYRDPFFRGSSSLTRLVAANVAEELGLTEAERVDLSLAAVLRDLGRLAMGGRLVPKTGQETPESRRKIERHVDLALDLLEGIELPRRVRLAVRHHHERWDGAGYPDGLTGEAIPILARVLAVVDSFTAMVSPRHYRLPRKVPDAAREIRDEAGTQFDPAVVEALSSVLERPEQPHVGFVQRPHILLVNPDQPGAVVTAAKLCSAGYLAEVSADAAAARERLRRVPVSALVVSVEAGEEAAAAFVRDLRVDPLFASLPVVVVDADTVSLRVRLLESGADVCFPPGTTYAELQGTLGALVRRTLHRNGGRGAGESAGSGTDQKAPWLALQGDVSDFPLSWLLQVMKYDSRTAAIGIRTGSADGAIYLKKGDAVHAQIRGGAKGEPALREMLAWEKGRFTVQPNARPRESTIQSSIMHLLLTQAVAQDHAAAGIFGAVSD